MKIIRLPDSWAARIAAGEVIERPASVVKELVENALDAGAKEISVWVESAGVALIRVSDDGEGIAGDDLPLAIERHATSKIKDEADLWQISTLGFRGEALPSIGSVAKVEITSRTRQGDSGFRIAVDGGSAGGTIAAGCSAGTTVEVRDLFFNIPARRKFLKAPATELSHFCEVVNHATNVAQLGRGRFQKFPPRGDVEEEIAHLYSCARRAASGDRSAGAAAVDGDAKTAVALAGARRYLDLRDRADARQRLAAKSQGRDLPEIGFVFYLARGVALDGERQIVARDAFAVVAHADQRDAGALNPDGYLFRARIECILHELLDDGRGPLDHLAGSDARGPA